MVFVCNEMRGNKRSKNGYEDEHLMKKRKTKKEIVTIETNMIVVGMCIEYVDNRD